MTISKRQYIWDLLCRNESLTSLEVFEHAVIDQIKINRKGIQDFLSLLRNADLLSSHRCYTSPRHGTQKIPLRYVLEKRLGPKCPTFSQDGSLIDHNSGKLILNLKIRIRPPTKWNSFWVLPPRKDKILITNRLGVHLMTPEKIPSKIRQPKYKNEHDR